MPATSVLTGFDLVTLSTVPGVTTKMAVAIADVVAVRPPIEISSAPIGKILVYVPVALAAVTTTDKVQPPDGTVEPTA